MDQNEMNILSVFGGTIRTGGDTKSALALMKYLVRNHGCRISMLIPPGDNLVDMVNEYKEIVERISFFSGPLRPGRLPNSFGYRDITTVVNKEKIDLIHAYDYRCLAACVKASVKTQKPLVWTKAGGPVNKAFAPDVIPSIFYSRELKEGMCDQYGLCQETKHVISSRIDMEVFKPQAAEKGFTEQHDLPLDGKTVFMAIRLFENKRPWLENIMAFAENCGDLASPVNIVIAGEGPLLQEMKVRSEKVKHRNTGCGVRFVGPVFDMETLVKFYNVADIVLGNGRGIMEAMACRKAVVILGESQQAEVLGPDTIESVSRYNFSGRHFRHQSQDSDSIVPVLRDLLANNKRTKEAAKFSYHYIQQALDAQKGALRVAELYEQTLSQHLSSLDYLKWMAKTIGVSMKLSLKRRLLRAG
jgi:glycosyltransferase involved in cell wall biosynthesis